MQGWRIVLWNWTVCTVCDIFPAAALSYGQRYGNSDVCPASDWGCDDVCITYHQSGVQFRILLRETVASKSDRGQQCCNSCPSCNKSNVAFPTLVTHITHPIRHIERLIISIFCITLTDNRHHRTTQQRTQYSYAYLILLSNRKVSHHIDKLYA